MMSEASRSRLWVSVGSWRTREVVLAATGLALTLAVSQASAATPLSQGAPETRPVVEITTVSATFEGWLGGEVRERKETREPEGRSGPDEGVGRVDPETVPASWYFEYAPGTSCTGNESSTTAEHVEIAAGVDEVRTTVTGLRPGEQYTVCLIDWQNAAPGVTFTTLPEAGDETPFPGGAEAPVAPPAPVPAASGGARPQDAGRGTRLAHALEACEKGPRRLRARCERQVRKRYEAARRAARRT